MRGWMIAWAGLGLLGCPKKTDSLEETGDSNPPFTACEDQLVPAPTWFEGESTGELNGAIEWGQTHVIRSEEERWAPPLVAGRAALLLFSPETSLSADSDVRVAAWKDGALVGVLPMASPSQIAPALEQGLTAVPLEPYSDSAWSALLPWTWVQEGVTLTLGAHENGELLTLDHTLTDLGAPHTFTLSRARVVVFGDSDKATDTSPAAQIAQDYFAVYPASTLRWVDAAPWRIQELVVNSETGPVRVTSEGERLAVTSDPDRWNLLKHQFALRMNLANTGRGLSTVLPWEGDNSPVSFGTSVVSGWIRLDDGVYTDINNAPYAAGWTGWTAMWLGECGNTFIHEIGHSATLAHFDNGAASSWGIADEYPEDGVHLASHPWGFDTTRNQFRTWYRVDSSGPVTQEGGAVQGKHDPMNGGESPNALTCFPQYTPYHAWKIQDWQQSSPTFTTQNGEPGLYQWSADRKAYEAVVPEDGQQALAATNGPVATVVGTLGNTEASHHIYPAAFWPSGNVFTPPDPTASDAPAAFTGATHFLEIDYADSSQERALIAKGPIDDTGLYLFALNLDLERQPTQVRLYRAQTAYPDMDLSDAELLATRNLVEPESELPNVLVVGQGSLANGALTLTHRCEPGVNCDTHRKESHWRMGGAMMHFTVTGDEDTVPTECNPEDANTALTIPIATDSGETAELIVHAQRVLTSDTASWATSIDDITPWIDVPNLTHTLRLWIPYAPNADLAVGDWTHVESASLTAWVGEDAVSEIPIHIALTVHDTEIISLDEPFESPALSADDSSMYFVVDDPSIGPTTGVWWGDANPTRLTVPVADETTGESTEVVVDAWKKSCDQGWGIWWSLNSGQLADGACSHSVYLELPEADNTHLVSGHTYRSPHSQPVVFKGLRWHEPNAGAQVDRFAYRIEFTAP